MRGRDGASSSGLSRWLLPASVLHAALGLLAMVASRSSEPPMARAVAERTPAQTQAPATLELTLIVDADPATSVAEPSASPAAPPALSAPESPRYASDATPSLGSTSMPLASTVLPRASTSTSTSAPASPSRESREPSADTRDEPVATALEAADAPREPPTASAEPDERSTAPTLSLTQLGVGTTNPFASDPLAAVSTPAPLSPSDRANQRLQASLHQQWFESDRRRGLGPEGPVADAARRLLIADDGLLESNAVFNIRVDGGGRVTEVHVLEASSQVKAWQLIASRLVKELGPTTLRRPGTNQGWALELRLSSAMQLPSGRAPGLRTDILGLPLPGSAASGATNLSLGPTSPMPMPEPIDKIGRQLDRVMLVELGLLKLDADISDIAGAARRVVHVAVLSVDEGATP
ncbi:MAG TPA: hypothetical protein VMG12_20530 [Polyangiaceae bacterium]|nr:hypothetical protein [Polyangiaceae bacterium]